MRRNRQKEKTPDASGHMAAAPGVCCYLFVLVCEIEFLAVIVRIRHTFQLGKGLLGQRPHIPVHTRHTLVNRNRQSSINKYLDSIKNGASSSLYLQVTGTPQAIFLQTLASGWYPYFTYYFQPGDAYLGGDFFFPSSGKPDCVSFLEKLKMPMREVVVRHLFVSAQILLSGGKVSNCLFHPSGRVAVHKKILQVLFISLYGSGEGT